LCHVHLDLHSLASAAANQMLRFFSSINIAAAMIRHRSFKATIDLQDPKSAKAVAEETLSALQQSGSDGTTQYLHALINLAMCHYHLGEYSLAREVAVLAHSRVVAQKGSSNSLVYFSAKTAEKCSLALAASFKLHQEQQATTSSHSSALEPSAAKSLRSEAMLDRLASDATAYRILAENTLSHPNNAFMRSWRSTGFSDDSSQSDCHTKRNSAEHHRHRESIMKRSLSRVPK
jgi:hypothetical protein